MNGFQTCIPTVQTSSVPDGTVAEIAFLTKSHIKYDLYDLCNYSMRLMNTWGVKCP